MCTLQSAAGYCSRKETAVTATFILFFHRPGTRFESGWRLATLFNTDPPIYYGESN